MKRYTGILLDSAGNPRPATTLKVVISGTTTLASLFNDQLASISNPLTTASDGQFAFRVLSGTYDFLDTNNVLVMSAVQIFDNAVVGEWLNAGKVATSQPLLQLNVQDALVALNNAIGAVSQLVMNEIPSGVKDGSNKVFTLANTPDTVKIAVYLNGVRLFKVGGGPLNDEFTLSGPIITLGLAPVSTGKIFVDYYKA